MTDIAITNLTNSTDTVAGTGVFDLLITAVERQINAQYDAGRITGTDYATVYLGGLQAVLQQICCLLNARTRGWPKKPMHYKVN